MDQFHREGSNTRLLTLNALKSISWDELITFEPISIVLISAINIENDPDRQLEQCQCDALHGQVHVGCKWDN